LKKVGVQRDWTWEQTLRAAIQDPTFRAIKEPTARKEAIERYQDELKVQDKEREKERATKLRNDFRTMLSRHREIKHYTRWKTALPMIEGEAAFRLTDNTEEKKKLFREYITELHQSFEDKRYQDHEAAMGELASLMRDIQVTPETRWQDARTQLKSHPTFVNDQKYRTLADSEILDQFQLQIRRLWEDVNTIKQREKQLKHREERKARDGFIDLLSELKNQDKIKPDSTWKEVYPMVEDEQRYQALLDTAKSGKAGADVSTPQDLFFDVLDDFERELADVRVVADSVMKDARYRFTTKTTEEDFLTLLGDDKRTVLTNKSVLHAAYKKLHYHATLHEEDLARDEKRHQRKAIDALRSRIKRLDPPVDPEDRYDDIRPRLERYDEFTALTEDERRAAFDKHMGRLQEDAERDRERSRRAHARDDRSSRRSDRDRERRRSRSPPGGAAATQREREMDAYEADRRRAVEQRERQYRRSSNGGLSPPPREGVPRRATGRDVMDRGVDDRRLREDRYDRERRERDAERERAYVSRADPYAKAADLDYGESSDGPGSASQSVARSGGGGGGNGKRAGSEARERERASKRVRTEGRLGSDGGHGHGNGAGEKDAVMDADAEKEEVALQSGSEEGEIEEV